MATEFDPNDAVDQSSLEQKENQQPTISFDGYEKKEEAKIEVSAPDESGIPAENDFPKVTEQVTPEAPQQEPEEVKVEATSENEVQEIIQIEDDETPEVPLTSELPEWIEKLKNFHEETGGGFDEYMKYTKDFESLNETDVLKEFYKQTKPNYNDSDIDLLIEDKFGIEDHEDVEDLTREDRLKILSKKDELSKAKEFLNGNRDKYYADLKSGVHGAPEQYKEAVEFYTQHQKSTKEQQIFRDQFVGDSEKLFSEDFKGFTYEAGGKKFSLNIGNTQKVMESQIDINSVLQSFADDKGKYDASAYHKAVWSAVNADKIFNAAYEQGKASALKERAQATKNPSYDTQTEPSQPSKSGGVKFLNEDIW